jgi:hypothetical protein
MHAQTAQFVPLPVHRPATAVVLEWTRFNMQADTIAGLCGQCGFTIGVEYGPCRPMYCMSLRITLYMFREAETKPCRPMYLCH